MIFFFTFNDLNLIADASDACCNSLILCFTNAVSAKYFILNIYQTFRNRFNIYTYGQPQYCLFIYS